MKILPQLALFLICVAICRAETIGISLSHRFGNQRLTMGALRFENTAGETFSVTRLSYLLSNFALQDEEGQWIELEDSVAWVDLGKRRDAFLLENVPEGKFRAIRFGLGVDKERNHADPAQWPAGHPLNPALNNLHWNWQGGYIFAAIEGRYRKGDELPGYVYHLANDWNYRLVTLPIAIDTSEAIEINMALDLAALFSVPESLSFAEDGTSTHSHKDDVIANKLTSNVAGAFAVQRVYAKQPHFPKDAAKPIDLPEAPTGYPLKISSRFPIPPLPTDNPLLNERVELGEKLFFDTQLSGDNTVSCASCHSPDEVFSDKRVKSIGIHEQESLRHSMPLFNLAWKDQFFWDGRSPSVREQVLNPIQDTREMGSKLEDVVAKLKGDPVYEKAFKKAFGSGAITPETIGLALENYLLTLTSYNSRFDDAMRGKAQLSDLEKRGFQLFMTEFEPRSNQYGADCFHCHGGALFTDNRLHNNGLAILAEDTGLGKVTGNAQDMGKFSTPSLRNVALTAPYMHDGRFATLEEVIEHYSTGIVDSDTLDPNIAKHPRGGLQLADEDKAALVAFLKSLSDPQYAR